MTNQFDLNKFNSFLDAASQAISCDSACQQNKTAQELKNKYMNAESNLTLAEPQYQLAKRNYYTYVSGQNGYNNMVEKELNEKADLFIQKIKSEYDLEKNNILTKLDTYDGLLVNYKNIVDLHEKYIKENFELTKQLKEEKNTTLPSS